MKSELNSNQTKKSKKSKKSKIQTKPKQEKLKETKQINKINSGKNETQTKNSGKYHYLLTCVFISGFSALVYEIIYARAISLIIGSSLYAYSILLGIFMIGFGIGSILSKKIIKKYDPIKSFFYIEIAIGLYAISFIYILNRVSLPYVHSYFIADGNFYLFLLLLVVISSLILIIPALLIGFTFPLLSSYYSNIKTIGEDLGLLFSINTIGGVFGAIIGGLFLLVKLGLENTITITAILNLIVAIIVYLNYKKIRNYKNLSILIFSFILIISSFSFNNLDNYKLGIYYDVNKYENINDYEETINLYYNYSKILYSDFSYYGQVSVWGILDKKFLKINGKTDAGSSDLITQLLLSYLPMSIHENPKEIAIIGLGSGMTIDAARNYNVSQIDVFEINHAVVDANIYFEEINNYALDDEKVNLIIADARNYLDYSNKKYDIIISEPSNPWIEGESFLFTKEFYEIIDKSLNENGLFVQWIGGYDYSEEDFKILIKTINSVFPNLKLWYGTQGGDYYLISSKKHITLDYYNIKDTLKENTIFKDFRKIAKALNKESLSNVDLFFSFYLSDSKNLKYYFLNSEINTDNLPIIEFNTAKNRIKKPHDNLVPILVYLGNGKNPSLIPEIKSIIREVIPKYNTNTNINMNTNINTRIQFLNLEVNINKMKLKSHAYEFKYYALDQSNLELRPYFFVNFEDEKNKYWIYALPFGERPTPENFEQLASNFNSKVNKINPNTQVNKNLVRFGENNLGAMIYCKSDKMVYVNYFEETTTNFSNNLFKSINCLE